MDRADDGWIKQRWASYSEEMRRGGGSVCTGLRLPMYQREWDHTHRLEDAKEGDLMMRTHDDRMLERIFDQSYRVSIGLE